MGGPVFQRIVGTESLWRLDGDDYAASRLLIPDWLMPVLGERHPSERWLLSAPTRNVLLATPIPSDGIGSTEAVILLYAAIAMRRTMPNPFPPNLVQLNVRDGELHKVDLHA
jgi:hypothetical protein